LGKGVHSEKTLNQISGETESGERFGPVGAQKEKKQGLLPLSGKNRENGHATQVAVYKRDAAILKMAAFVNQLRPGFAIPGKWLRGRDLNPRPSGYEPDELPGCSTPRSGLFKVAQNRSFASVFFRFFV
jgi:hypothetical protein